MELVDEWELWLYIIALEQLKRQKAAVADASMFIPGFWEREAEIMALAFTPALVEIMEGGIVFATPDEAFDDVGMLFESERFYAQQHAAEMVRNINEVTQRQVNELIQQSVTEGWGIDELTEKLGEWFSETRATRIAVTETTNAFMGGAELSYRELQGQGKEVVMRWLTANDDIVCEICAPRHLKLRGDGWTDPKAAHVNCRCTVVNEVVVRSM